VNDKRSKHARGLLQRDRVDQLAALPGWVWDANEFRWQEGLRHLRRFVEREGHARVPDDYVWEGFRLGTWVGERRSEYRDRRISDQRVKTLEDQPAWVWHARDAAWNELYDRLRKFYEREGHSRVLPRYVEDGVKLGAWVVHQRVLGRDGRIRADRRALLERIPDWAFGFEDEREQNWLAMFERLKNYVIEHRTAQVPLSYRDGEVRLGAWVNKQRAAHNGDRMSPVRVRRLESLPGWVWEVDLDAAWDEAYERLTTIVAELGSADIKKDRSDNGFRVGNWVNTQRQLRRQGKLSAERVAKLEALPGWIWDANEAAFERGYASLRAFVEREGHIRVPKAHEEGGVALHNWVALQRNRCKDPDRRAKLEQIPGWTWAEPRRAPSATRAGPAG
jgi:hypothetical protein